jgi:hypothetical protein
MTRFLSTLALTGLLLAGGSALADDPFGYDTVNPSTRFQYNSIEPGRNQQPAGSLSGTEFYGQGGPLGATEGPGVPMEPPGGYSGAQSMIDCGPGGRYISPTDAYRVGQLYPMACGRGHGGRN